MQKLENLFKRFACGDMVVVFDGEDRENEADIIVPIEYLTPVKVAFLAEKAKGLICAPISSTIANEKNLVLMPTNKADVHSTAFTLSIDSKKTKTGISPMERCITALDLINPNLSLKDFVTPGHLFPLIAKDGGVLERRGHTEAATSLCRWAKLKEAALICEMIHPNGHMYSKQEAMEFAEKYNLAFCTIDMLIEYQQLAESNVVLESEAKLPTEYAVFNVKVYREKFTNKEHLFLSLGENYTSGLVRIHSECLTGDVFSSKTCDCGKQLNRALQKIATNGAGAVIYLRQEGRNIGLSQKIKAYAIQQKQGLDTVEANIALGHSGDERNYHQAAWILKEEGFSTVNLLTNNPDKKNCLVKHGLNVEMINLEIACNAENIDYMKSKKNKMGHFLNLEGVSNE